MNTLAIAEAVLCGKWYIPLSAVSAISGLELGYDCQDFYLRGKHIAGKSPLLIRNFQQGCFKAFQSMSEVGEFIISPSISLVASFLMLGGAAARDTVLNQSAASMTNQ